MLGDALHRPAGLEKVEMREDFGRKADGPRCLVARASMRRRLVGLSSVPAVSESVVDIFVVWLLVNAHS